MAYNAERTAAFAMMFLILGICGRASTNTVATDFHTFISMKDGGSVMVWAIATPFIWFFVVRHTNDGEDEGKHLGNQILTGLINTIMVAAFSWLSLYCVDIVFVTSPVEWSSVVTKEFERQLSVARFHVAICIMIVFFLLEMGGRLHLWYKNRIITPETLFGTMIQWPEDVDLVADGDVRENILSDVRNALAAGTKVDDEEVIFCPSVRVSSDNTKHIFAGVCTVQYRLGELERMDRDPMDDSVILNEVRGLPDGDGIVITHIFTMDLGERSGT